mmetsp:Transcript_8464/g.9659  ORF Transcript_8464/g.9659 Transcript_8464/m.9659 type:complete len:109 (+) Transcript_8464:718-1044(+)
MHLVGTSNNRVNLNHLANFWLRTFKRQLQHMESAILSLPPDSATHVRYQPNENIKSVIDRILAATGINVENVEYVNLSQDARSKAEENFDFSLKPFNVTNALITEMLH